MSSVIIEDADVVLASIEKTVRLLEIYAESYAANRKVFTDLEQSMMAAIEHVKQSLEAYNIELLSLTASGGEGSCDASKLQQCQNNILACQQKLGQLDVLYRECQNYMAEESNRQKSAETIVSNCNLLAHKCNRLVEYIKRQR